MSMSQSSGLELVFLSRLPSVYSGHCILLAVCAAVQFTHLGGLFKSSALYYSLTVRSYSFSISSFNPSGSC